MTHLSRGQIYNAFLGRDARPKELGGKEGRTGAFRHVVIVSSSVINKNSDRVTIAPVMNYKLDGKELHINWGFWLPNRDVEDARLNDHNFVECGQLWTVFSPHTSEAAKNKLPRDINLNNYRGTLRYRERLDLALQIAINDRIIISKETRNSKFNNVPMQGDVVEIDLPNHHERAQALVISAPGMDSLRNLIPQSDTNKPLGHVTVIPLEKQIKTDASLVPVKIHGEKGIIHEWQALCYEIYTIDWKDRRPKIVGAVRDMDRVIRKLRQYLDLPVLTPAASAGADESGGYASSEQHLAGEGLANEIRRVSELSISLGLAYRSIQQDAQQAYLSYWEPDIFSVEEPIKAITIDTGFVDSINTFIELCFASFHPVQLAVPRKAGVADSIEPFPREQPLPLEWFDGHAVFLRFHRGPAGNWSVSRTGLSEELFIQLWSRSEQALGPPLQVGDRPVHLPTEGLEDLSTIKIRLASAQESKDE